MYTVVQLSFPKHETERNSLAISHHDSRLHLRSHCSNATYLVRKPVSDRVLCTSLRSRAKWFICRLARAPAEPAHDLQRSMCERLPVNWRVVRCRIRYAASMQCNKRNNSGKSANERATNYCCTDRQSTPCIDAHVSRNRRNVFARAGGAFTQSLLVSGEIYDVWACGLRGGTLRLTYRLATGFFPLLVHTSFFKRA